MASVILLNEKPQAGNAHDEFVRKMEMCETSVHCLAKGLGHSVDTCEANLEAVIQ